MEFQEHKCDVCGEQFQVACFSELQEKFRNHRCRKVNKRVERTNQLQQKRIAFNIRGITTDRIQQHNFDKLVQQGMLVNA